MSEGFTLAGSRDKGILLIHGLSGAPGEMRPLARLLQRDGFTVHVPLLAGHGAGQDALFATGWRDWLGSVEQAHDRLAGEVAQTYAAGVCAGALLAVMLAARRPEISGLAAYSTTFRYDGWSLPRVPRPTLLILLLAGLPPVRARRFAEREPFGIKDERIRAWVVRSMRKAGSDVVDSFPLGSLRQHVLLARATERAAGRVRAPALIVHARDDDLSRPANATHLRDRLGGPAQIAILDDSYHMIHLDRENGRVAQLTANHFGRPLAAAARRA